MDEVGWDTRNLGSQYPVSDSKPGAELPEDMDQSKLSSVTRNHQIVSDSRSSPKPDTGQCVFLLRFIAEGMKTKGRCKPESDGVPSVHWWLREPEVTLMVSCGNFKTYPHAE